MLATEILKTCKAQGVILEVLDGNRLKVRAPKGKVGESLLKSIKDEKNNLIRMMTDEVFFDHHMDQTIADLNQAGISLMDYPASTRHRAFVLEDKITSAANEHKREDFLRLLQEWRNCFH